MSITNITPRLGAIVHYTLTEMDANVLSRRRIDAGQAVRAGNPLEEGMTFPAMIVRDWASDFKSYLDTLYDTSPDYVENLSKVDEWTERQKHLERVAMQSVNLQVFLDGNDSGWMTSRTELNREKHGHWVQRIDGLDHLLPQDHQRMLLSGEATPERDFVFIVDPRGHWTSEPVADERLGTRARGR